MARPIKDGVDYFPKDTGFYGDDKVRLLRAEFGPKGMYFLDFLLCDLYAQNGYFMQWSKDKCFLVSDGAGCGCDPNFAAEFIAGCIRCSFFDKRVFDMFGTLTSAGIQRRYIRMFNSRDEITVLKEYWLLDINDRKDVPSSVLGKLTFKNLKSTENPVKSTENPVKSTENTQSKLNEIKESDICDEALPKIAAAFESEFGKLIGGKDRQILIDISSQYDVDLTIEAIRRAKTNGANSAAYIKSMLLRWSEQGITTVQQLNKPKPTKNSKPDYSDPARYSTDKDGDINEIFGSP